MILLCPMSTQMDYLNEIMHRDSPRLAPLGEVFDRYYRDLRLLSGCKAFKGVPVKFSAWCGSRLSRLHKRVGESTNCGRAWLREYGLYRAVSSQGGGR